MNRRAWFGRVFAALVAFVAWRRAVRGVAVHMADGRVVWVRRSRKVSRCWDCGEYRPEPAVAAGLNCAACYYAAGTPRVVGVLTMDVLRAADRRVRSRLPLSRGVYD